MQGFARMQTRGFPCGSMQSNSPAWLWELLDRWLYLVVTSFSINTPKSSTHTCTQITLTHTQLLHILVGVHMRTCVDVCVCHMHTHVCTLLFVLHINCTSSTVASYSYVFHVPAVLHTKCSTYMYMAQENIPIRCLPQCFSSKIVNLPPITLM